MLSHDEQMRLIGHRDGVVTGLLEVRRQISAIEYRYQHTSPRHTKKLAKKAAMLMPLRELETVLEKKRVEIQNAYDGNRESSRLRALTDNVN